MSLSSLSKLSPVRDAWKNPRLAREVLRWCQTCVASNTHTKWAARSGDSEVETIGIDTATDAAMRVMCELDPSEDWKGAAARWVNDYFKTSIESYRSMREFIVPMPEPRLDEDGGELDPHDCISPADVWARRESAEDAMSLAVDGPANLSQSCESEFHTLTGASIPVLLQEMRHRPLANVSRAALARTLSRPSKLLGRGLVAREMALVSLWLNGSEPEDTTQKAAKVRETKAMRDAIRRAA